MCQQAYVLEDLARSVAGPDVVAILPDAFGENAFVALARRSGTRMLFEATSRVCAPRLVVRMQQLAAEREAAGDRSSTLVGLVGELTVAELFRIESENEGWEDTRIALVTRPKQKRSQLLVISRDDRLPRAPLRHGTLTEPLSPHRIGQLLSEFRADGEVPVRADASDFPAWLVAGASASAELMLAPTAEGGEIAIQLLRQLGEPALADRISRLCPLELDYDEDGGELDEEDREALLYRVEQVARDFENWLLRDGARLGDDTITLAGQDVELALEFRSIQLGGEARGAWTDEELDAFLLTYVPRTVITSDADRVRLPISLQWLFQFLGERGDMIPPAAEKLARRAVALSEEFGRQASAAPPESSAALIAAMLAEDVDLADAAAVDAWMTGFDERSFEERGAILGLAEDG